MAAKPHVVKVIIRCRSEEDGVTIVNRISDLLEAGQAVLETKLGQVETAGIYPAERFDAPNFGEVQL